MIISHLLLFQYIELPNHTDDITFLFYVIKYFSNLISRTCLVCPQKVSSSSHLLSEQQRKFVFFKRGIFVPPGARGCRRHVHNKQLTYESIQRISASRYDKLSLDKDDIENMIFDFRSILGNMKTFDFGDSTSLSDKDYFNFTGLQKDISFFFLIKNLTYSG